MKMREQFSQTDIDVHEAWILLSRRHPLASALLHALIVLSNKRNAVVISQSALAKRLQCSKRSVARSIDVLVKGNWIEKRQLGSTGSVNGYILNSRVSWKDSRKLRGLSAVTAQVYFAEEEQPDRDALCSQEPLHIVETDMFSQIVPFTPGVPQEEQLDFSDLITPDTDF